MRNVELAADYVRRADVRLRALDVLFDAGSWADVVRESQEAVELALKGHNSVMPTVDRISDVPYKYRIGMAPLSQVANVEKFMPRDFISKDGFGITAKCRRYLAPLIQGEDYPKFKDGLPVYATMKNVAVRKRLASFELK